MAEVICPHCKAPNRDTARFCADCGAALVINPDSEPRQPPGPRPKNTATPTPGTILEGRYRIESELGRGGFGAVFKALDLRLNKPVAVKENLDASPEAQRQFAREATVLANLAHPNLPRVIDHFSIPDLGQYLVMDFVAGEDLNTMITREGRLPLEAAVIWILQVAEALDYLHNQDPPVFHRDIKPANIRITRATGPHGRAILVDFGLVKFSDPSVKTTMGARAITPGYAPPEQYGVGFTDARTDIYALGATLYAAVTGCEPVESVQRLTGKIVLSAQAVNPAVPASLSRAADRAMCLDPGQRYQSAADFRAALQACLVDIRAGQAGAGGYRPAPPIPATMRSDSQPRPISGPGTGPDSGPRPAAPLDFTPLETHVQVASPGGPRPAGVGAYMAAPPQTQVAPQPVSRPVARPAPSRPVSRPLSAGKKKVIGASAIVAVVLCLGLAAGGYALFSSSWESRATQTALAQSTAIAYLDGTRTAQAVFFADQTQGPLHSLTQTAAQAAADRKMTATVASQAEATEKVKAMRAEWTAVAATKTYVAQATMQKIEQFIPNEARGKLRFSNGPISHTLRHDNDEYMETHRAPGDYTNFVLEVVFKNPYPVTQAPWDYGVLFRQTGAGQEYRLILQSGKTWKLYDGTEKLSASGTLGALDTTAGASNTLVLVCLEDRGWFYLNGNLVKELSLTTRQKSGDVSIGTGFFKNSEIAGESTSFSDLNLWTIIWP